jgi:Bifunctional DNA primase/polymerase, N-terminal
MISSADRKLAIGWANLYRERGFNVLPSRPDAKRPICRYAHLWETMAPDEWFTESMWPNTGSLQAMCGRAWRLLVIDLDGDEAITRWQGMGRSPRTWVSHSGGGGRHLWFRLPESVDKPLGKVFLWKAKEKHSAIERLCDQSLVMAPPSIHPVTGQRYRFLSKGQSPLGLGMPADCPAWVLGLRPAGYLEMTRVGRPALQPAVVQASNGFDRNRVLDSIPDKLALARQWGVRLAGRPNAKGWAPCHAIDRDDVHPSAAIHQDSGSYVDHGSGVKLSLFDLGAELGIYSDWLEAVRDLGQKNLPIGY